MSCKGSCLASVGADQPAEVVYDAPMHMDLVCTLKHILCFLVMVYISTPGDCAPVHSVSWVSLALNFVYIMSNIKVAFFIGLLWIKIYSELKSSLDSLFCNTELVG
ncbi:hypothetical protein ACSQ67_022402 [Phaseolus vulgaris]